jgi:prepilin-type N-terminal cleavage/methylation domain-containing protein
MVSTPLTSRRLPAKTALQARRRAFTMIEILVVIGIILILTGIVMVAVRRLGTTSKEHATHITLSNLQGMLNDYGSTTGFKTEPADWVLSDFSVGSVSTSTTTPPYTTSFWTGLNQGTGPYFPAPIASPTNVSDTGSLSVRTGSPEIMNTLVAMNLLCHIPANRTAVSNMPPQTLLVPTFASGSIPTAGADGVWGTSDDSSSTIVYPIGCHVQSGGKFYVSLLKNSDSAPTIGNWRDESAAPQQAPLLLDAWGNPIIYVPGGGLSVQLLNGGTTYDASNTNLIKGQTVTSPDKRPFWASAGPDGDFSHGDDNIYSFEQ